VLRNLQEDFYAAMYGGGEAEAPLRARLIHPPEVAQRRLAAYRRSIFGNLNAALLATYPVLANIVGLAFFREAARLYLANHPSLSGDLNELGGDFGDFLAAYPPAAELPYLPDTARLEWLVQNVYYAADSDPADLSGLAHYSPDEWGELRFRVHPAHARLDSPWPLADIWRVNQPAYAGDMRVDFSCPCQTLIYRRDGLVEVAGLAAGETALLDALAAGDTLESATIAALAAQADFDLGAGLQRLAGFGLLLGVAS
jgi:hypothetical protein